MQSFFDLYCPPEARIPIGPTNINTPPSSWGTPLLAYQCAMGQQLKITGLCFFPLDIVVDLLNFWQLALWVSSLSCLNLFTSILFAEQSWAMAASKWHTVILADLPTGCWKWFCGARNGRQARQDCRGQNALIVLQLEDEARQRESVSSGAPFQLAWLIPHKTVL